MPELIWEGKDAVINYHHSLPVRELKIDQHESLSPKPSLDDNLIIEGDNIEVLKSLIPKFASKVDVVYIDPPYNTGNENENWVYNDNLNSPQIKSWLGKVVGKEDLQRHDKWLCMMYPRLVLARELLSESGVIFISIDDNEVNNLRLMMNEIFGEENFISNFLWKRKKEVSNDSKNVSIQGEYILCYQKTDLALLKSESLSEHYVENSYSEPNQQFPLGRWRPVPITVSKGLSGGGYEYTINTPSGAKHTRIWAYPEASYKELLANKLIYFGQNNNAIPQRVIYAKDSKGQPATNYWDIISSINDVK
jgi:adenine-specific DNA-methyltransferase